MSFEQKQYWLKGVEYERNRIIKLLENSIKCDWMTEHCEACDQTDYLVALIKGSENVDTEIGNRSEKNE